MVFTPLTNEKRTTKQIAGTLPRQIVLKLINCYVCFLSEFKGKIAIA